MWFAQSRDYYVQKCSGRELKIRFKNECLLDIIGPYM